MNIAGLVNGFLVYLQHNYAKLDSSRYQPSWITKQTTDFQQAILYTEQAAPDLLSPGMNADILDSFIKNIHQHCAKEVYRITQNSMQGASVQTERVGVFRTSESFSMKNVPLFNMHDVKDQAFLRVGKMPKILDGRLHIMGHAPSIMSQKDKERALNGQVVWLEANSVFQIAAYIETHIDSLTSYYFLCGYYRENFVNTSRTLTEKDRMFAQFMETEINTLAAKLSLRFNKASLILSMEEKSAIDLVYINYLSPDKIAMQFTEYAHTTVQKMKQLDLSSANEIANFCFNAFQPYILIHPFLDANYRTFTIFINTFLAQAGYEYINFHDPEIKTALDTPFGKNEPDQHIILRILSEKLIKKPSQSAISNVNLFNYEDPGKAMRNATANGRHDELVTLLKQHPDIINAVDQNPTKGWTALHWAVHKNQLLCTKTLLELGAQYNISDKTLQQATAMDICLSKSETELKQIFIEHFQKKYMKEEIINIDKMLRTVANFGDLDAVKLLIAIGADINSFGPETGQTALHRATQKQHIFIVSILIENGADLDLVDKKGKRAIDYVQNNQALATCFTTKASLVV